MFMKWLTANLPTRNRTGRQRSRIWLSVLLAAILIAGAAAFVLNTYVPDTSVEAFSTQAVRI